MLLLYYHYIYVIYRTHRVLLFLVFLSKFSETIVDGLFSTWGMGILVTFFCFPVVHFLSWLTSLFLLFATDLSSPSFWGKSNPTIMTATSLCCRLSPRVWQHQTVLLVAFEFSLSCPLGFPVFHTVIREVPMGKHIKCGIS